MLIIQNSQIQDPKFITQQIIINFRKNLKQRLKNSMIIIDAVLFILIVALLHYYKSSHPNFLFFCKGAILFLPPDDDVPSQHQQSKPLKKKHSSERQPANIKRAANSNKEKQGHQVSIIQVEYNQVKTYPFCTEYQRIALTLTALVIFYTVRAILYWVLPGVSYLPFYILIAITVYTVKVSVDIFMFSAYRSKTCLIIAFGLNLFFLFLLMTLGNYEGVYDSRINNVAQDYTKHLQVIMGHRTINWINQYTVMGFVVFINFFITLAAIPSIVKFGNWYAKTLKEVYYEQDHNDQSMHKLLNTTKQSTKQAQKQVKQHSKSTISLLNYYLIATLVFIFFSHRFSLVYLPEWLVDSLRLVFFTTSVAIILWTSKDAVQFNSAFAYKFVLEYFKQKTAEGRLALRKKIVPYIYHIWYHFHQFLIRIIIPILLVGLIVHWKYLAAGSVIQDKHIQNRQINFDIECSINTNELDLIKNLYKCPIKSYRQMEEQMKLTSYNVISGGLTSEKVPQPPSGLQQKIVEYGIINRQFMLQFCELLLWYSNITIYGMTVIYVLFLRKTVYQI